MRPDVVGFEDLGNHGHPFRAAIEDGLQVAALDAADRHEGQCQVGGRELKVGQSDGGAHVALGLRGVQGAHPDVVNRAGRGVAALCGSVRGEADQHGVAELLPRHFRRQVVLAQVHAVRLHGARQVHVIVHDEQRAVGGAQVAQAQALPELLQARHVLLAELDDVHAGLELAPHAFQVAPAAREGLAAKPVQARPCQAGHPFRFHAVPSRMCDSTTAACLAAAVMTRGASGGRSAPTALQPSPTT